MAPLRWRWTLGFGVGFVSGEGVGLAVERRRVGKSVS